MGDAVNVLLDDLDALLLRLVAFPLVMQWLCWMTLAAAVAALFMRLLARAERPRRAATIRLALWTASVLLFLLVMDQRLRAIEALFEDVRATMLLPAPTVPASRNQAVHPYNANGNLPAGTAAQRSAGLATPGARPYTSGTLVDDNGLRIERIAYHDPNAICYLATIELAHWTPVLDSDIAVKERTSTFCQRFGLTFGVNGEAGTSPGMDAPLGKWKGLYVVDGNTILAGDDHVRPFLYFDKDGRCGYSPGHELHHRPTERMHNVIWGRWDLLVEGRSAIAAADGTRDHHYPRTIMGTDRFGATLYVLVVDGRRAHHSRGMTSAECAELLLERGVYAAMSCDQGGSCTMYHRDLGLVNRPPDGRERPVYTHLGLKPRD